MNHCIKVTNVSKAFGETQALKNISFEVKKGSITGLLGPNGSGKTTILRILNGLIKEDEGEVTVFGDKPSEKSDKILDKVGVVTDGTELYNELSTFDNLKFFAALHGKYDEEKIDKLLKKFDMFKEKHEPIKNFSTGMKKRVALVKALLHDPEILFLDEPTNGLDPEGIQLVMEHLKKINKEKDVTILICTHVLRQLEDVCDSLIFINKGNIIESGERKTLEKKYLKEINLRIETDIKLEKEGIYKGFSYKKEEENLFQFITKDIDEVPTLLQKLTNNSNVYSSTITNRNLETLYFEIRRENIEQREN